MSRTPLRSLLTCLLLAACNPSPAPSAPEPASSSGNEMERAYMIRMQSDLRNLVTAQEIHYSQHYRYAGPAEDVGAVSALRFTPSQAIAIRVTAADDRGWAAIASSPQLPGRGCSIFVGNAAAVATPGGATPAAEGTVTCD